MAKGKYYTKAQKAAYARRQRRKKLRPKKNYISRNPNTPLMPPTRVVKMRYTTRFQIDPPEVKSGDLDTAANTMAVHTLYANMLNDTDYTSASLLHVGADGAQNHQPRMYDQWNLFYNYNTVLGSHITIKAINQRNVRVLTQTTTAAGAVTSIPVVTYDPVYVGIIKNRRGYSDNKTFAEKYDDIKEKKLANFKLLKGGPSAGQPVVCSSGWSLKKEPGFHTKMELKDGESSQDWGAKPAFDIPDPQRRYYHIVAHPASMEDAEDPKPITVEAVIDYIVLLSDLKDQDQSA